MLILNGDDFGYARGVTDGIVDAHRRGVLTSTSLMVDSADAPRAAEVAAGCPALSLGLHLVHESPWEPGAVARAFAAQLERFRELTGEEPTHVDSHHHVHLPPERMAMLAPLVEPLGVPLRGDGRVRFVGDFWGQDEDRSARPAAITPEALLELIAACATDGVTEIGCHPGFVTGDLRSSYARERETELATLTTPGLRSSIEALGVRLSSYTERERWG